MKWSWKLVRVAGIDVYIHATFFLLLFWVGYSYWIATQNWSAVMTGISFIILLFVCVVMHEYGHALTARRYGIGTKKITLYPIGGVAQLAKMPDDPRQEIKVAFAGPAVNIVIALVLWIILQIAGFEVTDSTYQLTPQSLLFNLMIINLALAIFNLLPAFPMDGGRVFRAWLATRMERDRATRIAANVGQVLAIGLGILGMMYNPFLIFIAVFVWIGAASESGMEQIKAAMNGKSIRHVMQTEFHTLAPGDTLQQAIDLTLQGSQKDFPVMYGTEVVGVLTQKELLLGLQQDGSHARVESHLCKNTSYINLNDNIQNVIDKLPNEHCNLLMVVDQHRLVGVINMENLMEYFQIHRALVEHEHPSHY